MLIVPAHILLSVCGDTETETNTLTSKVIATFRAGNIMEKIKMAFRSNSQWGPVDIQEKKDWQEYCEETKLSQWLPEFIKGRFNFFQKHSCNIIGAMVEMPENGEYNSAEEEGE